MTSVACPSPAAPIFTNLTIQATRPPPVNEQTRKYPLLVLIPPNLRQSHRECTRLLPKRPPSSFLPPQWRRLIFANGAADRRLYETAVLATLREKLRGSNIWVAGSRDYRAFEDFLLAPE